MNIHNIILTFFFCHLVFQKRTYTLLHHKKHIHLICYWLVQTSPAISFHHLGRNRACALLRILPFLGFGVTVRSFGFVLNDVFINSHHFCSCLSTIGYFSPIFGPVKIITWVDLVPKFVKIKISSFGILKILLCLTWVKDFLNLNTFWNNFIIYILSYSEKV